MVTMNVFRAFYRERMSIIGYKILLTKVLPVYYISRIVVMKLQTLTEKSRNAVIFLQNN